ncbi:Protein kinase domain-containing protein [Mycena indigotica]|uniref:Protein kinase domain-containing protein n=1 Tax=Mycena indigotica TaxID=2126181 RepID=A0A8H6TG62_9AGAR|nr:Protein kinase domain-containing protein [Mycena indigotica]KAF7316147.1 Protein kinase domain-containing protein [Mycena indigotica]
MKMIKTRVFFSFPSHSIPLRPSPPSRAMPPEVSTPLSSLQMFDPTSLSPTNLPKKLILLTLALLDPSSPKFHELSREIQVWSDRDIVASLATYASVVDTLFDVLKEAHRDTAIVQDVFDKLCEDIEALHDHMLDLLHTPDTYQVFLTSSEDQSQQLLDLLQELLDLFPDSTERPVLSKALLRISRASGRLPTCLSLSGLQKIGKQVAAGGFADIWKGLIRGQSVSVKIMRLFRDDDIRDILQTFGREALIWRQLSHPNLLPFFGLYYLDSRLCLVSPWMADGHVLEYLKTAPPDTDRVSLMLDVALGIEYLHENNVVHGDLKAMNILVTPSHRACVADFGLSSITDAMTLKFPHSTASVRGGTPRYQAPELINTDNVSHYPSDVYAFACVCYEIWSQLRPFHEINQDIWVGIQVLGGLRPTKPQDMAEEHPLWLLLQEAWVKDPTERPTMTHIVHRLVGDSIGATIRSYGSSDWDETFSSRFRRSFQPWPLLPSLDKIKRRLVGNDEEPHMDSDSASTSSPRPELTPLPPISTLFASTGRRRQKKSRLQSLYLPVSCLTANHYVPIPTDDPVVEVFVSTHDLEVHRVGLSHNLPSLPQMSPSSSQDSSPVGSPPPAERLPDLETLRQDCLRMLSNPHPTLTPRSELGFLTSPQLNAIDLELGGRTLIDDAPIPEFPATPRLSCSSSFEDEPLIDPSDRWSESNLVDTTPDPAETPSPGSSAGPTSDSPRLIYGPPLRSKRASDPLPLRLAAKRRRTEPAMSIRSLCE